MPNVIIGQSIITYPGPKITSITFTDGPEDRKIIITTPTIQFPGQKVIYP